MKSFFVLLLSFPLLLSAQTDSTAEQSNWKHTLIAGLTLTQVTFTDWAQGGENALAYTLGIDGKSVQDLTATNWSNSYKFAYGQTKLGSKGLRKTDDKIELESVLTYKLGTHVNPYASATFKSQFDDGYKYDDVANTKTKISSALDPMYLTQAVGIGYQPVAEVKTRLGAALREVFDKNRFGYSDDGKTTPEIEASKVEGGLESVTDIEIKIEENTLFTAKLEMFAPFNNIDVVVVRSDNTLSSKVSKYISLVFNVQLINDRSVTAKTQIKEGLALGISYALL
ncbi:MAG: DUF3078 domain-containing protein [Bacteroidetes bacterium]|nr:DUF3078 domain-containing protein [Bacteroidota bacterium]